MSVETQESTYSTLCYPLLEAINSADAPEESFQANASEFRSFLRSLELQHEAYLADTEASLNRISEVEKLLASTQLEFEQHGRVVDALQSEVDTQRNIASLAKAKFASPIELDVEGRPMTATLNKSVAQLEEDHHFLEQQLTELEDSLAKETAELDRRIAVSAELQDLVLGMRDKLLSGQAETNAEEHAKEDAKEPEEDLFSKPRTDDSGKDDVDDHYTPQLDNSEMNRSPEREQAEEGL